jgi:hypothetical protein
VSSAVYMGAMFYNSQFKGDISKWAKQPTDW